MVTVIRSIENGMDSWIDMEVLNIKTNFKARWINIMINTEKGAFLDEVRIP